MVYESEIQYDYVMLWTCISLGIKTSLWWHTVDDLSLFWRSSNF